MRRQELQKIRTLMFHQEKKFKREKKIKSKRYVGLQALFAGIITLKL